jgi:hypothetical protein
VSFFFGFVCARYSLRFVSPSLSGSAAAPLTWYFFMNVLGSFGLALFFAEAVAGSAQVQRATAQTAARRVGARSMLA